MKKTLIITGAIVVLVAAATVGVLALRANAGSHQTCGKVDQAKLRAAGDPAYAAYLEKLARCIQ